MSKKTRRGQAYKVNKIRQKARVLINKGTTITIKNLHRELKKLGITQKDVREHIDVARLERDIINGIPKDRRSPISRALQNIRREIEKTSKKNKIVKVKRTFFVTVKAWAIHSLTGEKVDLGFVRRKQTVFITIIGPEMVEIQKIAEEIKGEIEKTMKGRIMRRQDRMAGTFGYRSEGEWEVYTQLTRIL